jgi:hypothetical protein
MPFEQVSAEVSMMKLAPLSLVEAMNMELQAWEAVHKGRYMMGAVMMAQETGYW